MAILSRPTRKYWAIFKTQLINSFAYPGDLLSRSVTIIIFMWVFLLSYNGFCDEHENHGGMVFFLPERIIDSYFPWGKMYLIPDDPVYAASIKRAEEFAQRLMQNTLA